MSKLVSFDKKVKNTRKIDPWREGYAAAQNREELNSNPYDRKTESNNHNGWRTGWHDWTFQDPGDNYCGGY